MSKQPKTSTLPRSTDQTDPFTLSCPHCAVSQFLNLWRDMYPKTTGPEITNGLVETLGDILCNIENTVAKDLAIIDVAENTVRTLRDIHSGTYKADAQAALRQKHEGGLH